MMNVNLPYVYNCLIVCILFHVHGIWLQMHAFVIPSITDVSHPPLIVLTFVGSLEKALLKRVVTSRSLRDTRHRCGLS